MEHFMSQIKAITEFAKSFLNDFITDGAALIFF
jgi:hypothetical protein